VNFSGRKVSKRVKESDHLANQDSLRAQDSLKHVEINSKLELWSLLFSSLFNLQCKKISALSIGLLSLLFMS
jgi:hypothetical protein